MSTQGSAAYAYAVSLVLIGAVMWPAVRTPPQDSFPLSTFPMFSRKRPAEVLIDHVVAVDDRGVAQVVPPQLVAGADVLQTKVAIAHAVRSGGAGRQRLCREVAARLAKEPDWRHAKRVEIRRDRFAVLKYFSDSREPIHSQVYVRCKVGPAT